MHTQSAAEKNSSIEVMPRPRAPWRVAKVSVLPNYCLSVVFMDGLEGLVDLNALIHSSQAGVFAVLANSQLFMQAYISFGAVTWPGEIDLAPDAMYDEIKAHGKWIVK